MSFNWLEKSKFLDKKLKLGINVKLKIKREYKAN